MTKIENLPRELQATGSFCLWKREEREGQITKVPYNPRTMGKAMPNVKSTFAPLEVASRALERSIHFEGLGIGIFDGISAMDIDDCLDDHGIPDERAASIIKEMGSYAEISPSGKGIRILFKATGHVYDVSKYYINRRNPENRKKGIEIYVFGATKKYVTVTGNAITPGKGMEERGDVLQAIKDKYMLRPVQPEAAKPERTATTVSLDDGALLDKARRANSKFSPLYDQGDTSGNGGDDSAADLALCNILAFWTARDFNRIDDLFRRSALMRDKWDRPTSGSTYGAITINKAIADCRNVYDIEAYRMEQAKRDFSEPIPADPQPEADAQDEPEESPEDKAAREFAEYWQQNSTGAYMARFHELVAETATRPAIPTGYKYLDNRLDGGLFEGLYIIGAISSLGKTTFILQAADNIAASGRDVLFFSMEMSKYELGAKSISRMTFMLDKSPGRSLAKSTRQILNGANYAYYSSSEIELIEAAREHHQTTHGTIYTIEATGEVGPAEIRKAVEKHKRLTGNTPVIMIDYLQILKPTDPRASDKQNTDWAVAELKRITREYKTPIIAVSSLNRENYHMPINLTSFKESGAIEYSSDVLIGMQVKGADEYSENTKGKNHKDTESKKNQDPREIELKILKSRNGSLGGKLEYQFYPRFNCFVEIQPVYTAVGRN